jgi:hypothetical protein
MEILGQFSAEIDSGGFSGALNARSPPPRALIFLLRRRTNP